MPTDRLFVDPVAAANWPHSGDCRAAELVAAYADAGGRSTEYLDWYVAMACFELAIVIEGTYSRYLAEQANREAGERLHDSASRLIDIGIGVTAGNDPFV